jgi:hypothetical protein
VLERVQAAAETAVDARTLDALATATTATTKAGPSGKGGAGGGRPRRALDEVLEDALRECEGLVRFVDRVMLGCHGRNALFWAKLGIAIVVPPLLETPLEEYAAVLRALPQVVAG